jgi:hypothetical protein
MAPSKPSPLASWPAGCLVRQVRADPAAARPLALGPLVVHDTHAGAVRLAANATIAASRPQPDPGEADDGCDQRLGEACPRAEAAARDQPPPNRRASQSR